MVDSSLDLNERIAARVRVLRAERGLSLEALAIRSGVSRSMISLVERGESSPTAVVLDRLAAGLGVTIGEFFDLAAAVPASGCRLATRASQPAWRDPASGYLRRNVTPPGVNHPMRIVEIEFPAGARVAFENLGHERNVQQQVWVLAGTIDVSSGEERHRLRQGDCLAMRLDRPSLFHNPGRRPARYAVVIAAAGEVSR